MTSRACRSVLAHESHFYVTSIVLSELFCYITSSLEAVCGRVAFNCRFASPPVAAGRSGMAASSTPGRARVQQAHPFPPNPPPPSLSPSHPLLQLTTSTTITKAHKPTHQFRVAREQNKSKLYYPGSSLIKINLNKMQVYF